MNTMRRSMTREEAEASLEAERIRDRYHGRHAAGMLLSVVFVLCSGIFIVGMLGVLVWNWLR